MKIYVTDKPVMSKSLLDQLAGRTSKPKTKKDNLAEIRAIVRRAVKGIETYNTKPPLPVQGVDEKYHDDILFLHEFINGLSDEQHANYKAQVHRVTTLQTAHEAHGKNGLQTAYVRLPEGDKTDIQRRNDTTVGGNNKQSIPVHFFFTDGGITDVFGNSIDALRQAKTSKVASTKAMLDYDYSPVFRRMFK